MDVIERQKYSYVRQKVWEALRCLVGRGQITKRIIDAGLPLVMLAGNRVLVEQLPVDVRNKFDEIIKLLTKHSPAKGFGIDSRIAWSARELSYQQMDKITANVLDIYVAVSGGL